MPAHELAASQHRSIAASQHRSIEQIFKAGWRRVKLISEILDLAQIEAGKMRLPLEPISLPEVPTEYPSRSRS